MLAVRFRVTEAELAEVATALGVNSEAEASESGDSSTADAQPKPPVIMGESTNNAEIETKPTPKKDNDTYGPQFCLSFCKKEKLAA